MLLNLEEGVLTVYKNNCRAVPYSQATKFVDKGTLTVYKNNPRLGMVKDGLVVWVVLLVRHFCR